MIIALNKIECVSVGGTFVCADLIPPTDYAINGNLCTFSFACPKEAESHPPFYAPAVRPELIDNRQS